MAIIASSFSGKSVGVFGLGKSGISTIKSLLSAKAKVFAWDDSEQARAAAPSKAIVSEPESWNWGDISTLVLSPGVPLTHPKPAKVVEIALQKGVDIIGDIEVLYRENPKAKYIGITGTNGKSTTTSLIAHILKCAGLKVEVGGNLGTPVLDLNPLAEDGIYVLETSSYQLDLIDKTRFHIAILLNISPDHLDRHGDMVGYVTAKKRIFNNQLKSDFAIIGVDDTYGMGIQDFLRSNPNHQQIIPVSGTRELAGGLSVYDALIYEAINMSNTGEYDISGIDSLTGEHNWQNAAFAIAAAKVLGVSSGDIYKGLRTFPGLAHRMETVATIKGVKFINDSKATNADAASKALGSYNNVYWIAGGKPKAGGIKSLKKYFPRITRAYLIGEAEEEFAETLNGEVDFVKCTTLEKAVEMAAKDAASEIDNSTGNQPVVLLSPACASFDQWKSFEHRGDAFRDMVLRMAKSK